MVGRYSKPLTIPTRTATPASGFMSSEPPASIVILGLRVSRRLTNKLSKLPSLPRSPGLDANSRPPPAPRIHEGAENPLSIMIGNLCRRRLRRGVLFLADPRAAPDA